MGTICPSAGRHHIVNLLWYCQCARNICGVVVLDRRAGSLPERIPSFPLVSGSFFLVCLARRGLFSCQHTHSSHRRVCRRKHIHQGASTSSIRWPAGPNPIIGVSTTVENKHSAANWFRYVFKRPLCHSFLSLARPPSLPSCTTHGPANKLMFTLESAQKKLSILHKRNILSLVSPRLYAISMPCCSLGGRSEAMES